MSVEDIGSRRPEQQATGPDLRHFSMPKQIKITGRLTSVTNAFVNSVIPVVKPTEEEVEEALRMLGMLDKPACAYCGDLHTERDHLRPLVIDRRPTGYIGDRQSGACLQQVQPVEGQQAMENLDSRSCSEISEDAWYR